MSTRKAGESEKARTDDHCGEVEALLDALPVDLVGQVREADVAHELFPDDVGESVGRAVRVRRGRGRVTVRVVGHLYRSPSVHCPSCRRRRR